MKLTYKLLWRREVVLLALMVCTILVMDHYAYAAFDETRYKTICSRVLTLLEGKFGAMLTAATGVGAVVSAALGSFKMAWGLVIVSVGCFIAKGYVALFFAAC